MSFVNIDSSTPLGSEKVSSIDNTIRQLKDDIESNLAEISGYPNLTALKDLTWTTATRPVGTDFPPANVIPTGTRGFNTTTGSDEHYSGTTWVSHGIGSATIQGLIDAIIPLGMIMMWKGSVATVPAHWHLCDGTSGTVDLRDKFIVAAGSTYAVAATGGAASHTLTTDEMPSHSHDITRDIQDGVGPLAGGWGFAKGSSSKAADIYTENTGGGESFSTLPPYYALCFIQRIS